MEQSLHLEDRRIQYIARISHGKDSLKMLDVIVSRGLPLDRITTTDIWATDTVRGEHPKMVAFKAQADEFIWKKYRIEVEHLCAVRGGKKMTYERMFYHIPRRRPKSAKARWEQGTVLGFPTLWHKWCQSELKRGAVYQPPDPEDQKLTEKTRATILGFPYQVGPWCQKLKHRGLSGPEGADPARGRRDIVEYLGIAADEPERFGQLNERRRAPLVEFGVEEELCGLYCQYNGILSPSYETSCRDGCWMCHNQGVAQLRALRRDYPELWALLLKWDEDSPVSFKPDGRTVHDYDERFQLEDEGFIKPEERFLWSMLEDGGVNYRLF